MWQQTNYPTQKNQHMHLLTFKTLKILPIKNPYHYGFLITHQHRHHRLNHNQTL
jgi:hypothetical protein